jgi:hypothetical protein
VTEQQEYQLVDHNALRTNQAVIIGFVAVGYVADLPIIITICGALMLLGSLLGKPAFLPVYRLLGFSGLIDRDLQPDHNLPHRFAQLAGSIFLLSASLFFAFSAVSAGWLLSFFVLTLAVLNLFFGFCLGCTLYYWLARIGVPGFDKHPVERAS